jgi:hypothetical protein
MEIGSKEDVVKIVQLIAEKTSRLVENTIGRTLPITYLTIFAKHEHEYVRLLEWTRALGTPSETNNGFRFSLNQPIQTIAGDISMIRIRKPDPERPQLGCADFEVEDYESFKTNELPKHPEHLKRIERTDYEMIEFYDTQANEVLAYVVS